MMSAHNMAIVVIAIAGALLVLLACVYRAYVHWRIRSSSSSNMLEYEEL